MVTAQHDESEGAKNCKSHDEQLFTTITVRTVTQYKNEAVVTTLTNKVAQGSYLNLLEVSNLVGSDFDNLEPGIFDEVLWETCQSIVADAQFS